jgi:hypothetical protein
MNKILNKKLFIVFFVFVCTFALSINGYAKIGYDSLPQLIHSAPYIAKGKITVQNDEVILNIEKMLKGENVRELTILFEHNFEAPDPKFTDGEKVILFLHIPDFGEGYIIPGLGVIPMPEVKEGEMYLFGLGDQAKWPKRYSGNYKFMPYPKLQDNASLDEIQDVVEKLLIIEDTNNIDEKVKLCTEYLKSSDKLLQYTILEFILYSGIWTSHTENLSWLRNSTKYQYILKNLSDEVFSISLIDDKEPTIRAEAIRFLRYTETYKAISILIPKLTDDDRLVRSVSREVLNIFSGELKISEELASYKSDDSMENYKSIQQKWKAWEEKNKDKFINKQ